MSKYTVTIHRFIKGDIEFWEDEFEHVADSYMEKIEADRFTATTPSEAGAAGTGVISHGMTGVRFYKGDEMVAFYDQALHVSVIRDDAFADEEDDDAPTGE